MKSFLASLYLAALAAHPVAAARCNDISIRIYNDMGEKMRVVQIRAYNQDDDRWRTIRTRNFEVVPTGTEGFGYDVPENVPNSRGERVLVRAKYKYWYGPDNTRYVTDSDVRTCNDGTSYTLRIPATGHEPG